MPQYIPSANALTITVQEWISAGLSYKMYEHDKSRGYLRTINRSSRGCPVLIDYNSLPASRKEVIKAAFGDPEKLTPPDRYAFKVDMDMRAYHYYSHYILPDGRNLPDEIIREYTATASILKSIHEQANKRIAFRKSKGGNANKKLVWEDLARSVSRLNAREWPHTLPTNARRLRDKSADFNKNGYDSLIHRNYGNQNSRKVTETLERLVISIYCMENLPFGTWVHEYYTRFVDGDMTIVDRDTGAIFDRADFYNPRKKQYLKVSDSTIWNILNNPGNALVIDRLRNNRIDHVTTNTPYNLRHNPDYSLSKISMDDRTLPRKTTDGRWVNAYYAMDVMSGAYLAAVYTIDKPSVSLVWDCFRELYKTVNTHSLVWPGEVETENHLMSSIRDQLHQMFAHVTFCSPGLSRAKRAEHLIRAKKYGDEKEHQKGIGRWNAKGKAYKIKSENKDEEYKQERLPLEQLIADDRESIERFNNTDHPAFPGKTRWDVLMQNQNPDLGAPIKYRLLKYLGHHTATSLTNNNYVQVQYQKYAIESYDMLRRMKPNNYKLDAYWLPNEDGSISELYLYQENSYLGMATGVERYNEAKVERTAKDEQVRQEQAARQAKFFKMEKDLVKSKITKVELIHELNDYSNLVVETAAVTPDSPEREPDPIDFNAEAEFYAERGKNDL